MAVQTVDLAAWWTEAKCRSHQPYPSRTAAERAASLHPISHVKCAKCNEGRPIVAFRCHSDPSHHHIGHDLPWSQEDEMASVAVIPKPVNPATRKVVGSMKAPSLTDEQAREIWRQVKAGRPKNVLQHEYGVKWWTIHQVAEGITYRAATESLRNGTERAEGNGTEEETVVFTQPLHIEERIEMSGTNGISLSEFGPTFEAPPSSLLIDMADAIDVLLDIYSGKPTPLPKFFRLDTDAIRALVAQARAAAPEPAP